MRYELTDHEWTAVKRLLLNNPRGFLQALANMSPRLNHGLCI
jgi:hypothetical protein